MVSRSTASTSAASPFDSLGSGLDFFKDWMQAASSGLPAFMQASQKAVPGAAPAWMLPTLDAKELEKRIQDLQAVKFWLEQNAQMVAMTIQTLEVQRMTLETLKGLKVPMEALQEAVKTGEQPGAVNPLAWWDALSQQFVQMTKQAEAVIKPTAKPATPSAAAKKAPKRATTSAGKRTKSGG